MIRLQRQRGAARHPLLLAYPRPTCLRRRRKQAQCRARHCVGTAQRFRSEYLSGNDIGFRSNDQHPAFLKTLFTPAKSFLTFSLFPFSALKSAGQFSLKRIPAPRETRFFGGLKRFPKKALCRQTVVFINISRFFLTFRLLYAIIIKDIYPADPIRRHKIRATYLKKQGEFSVNQVQAEPPKKRKKTGFSLGNSF